MTAASAQRANTGATVAGSRDRHRTIPAGGQILHLAICNDALLCGTTWLAIRFMIRLRTPLCGDLLHHLLRIVAGQCQCMYHLVHLSRLHDRRTSERWHDGHPHLPPLCYHNHRCGYPATTSHGDLAVHRTGVCGLCGSRAFRLSLYWKTVRRGISHRQTPVTRSCPFRHKSSLTPVVTGFIPQQSFPRRSLSVIARLHFNARRRGLWEELADGTSIRSSDMVDGRTRWSAAGKHCAVVRAHRVASAQCRASCSS